MVTDFIFCSAGFTLFAIGQGMRNTNGIIRSNTTRNEYLIFIELLSVSKVDVFGQ